MPPRVTPRLILIDVFCSNTADQTNSLDSECDWTHPLVFSLLEWWKSQQIFLSQTARTVFSAKIAPTWLGNVDTDESVNLNQGFKRLLPGEPFWVSSAPESTGSPNTTVTVTYQTSDATGTSSTMAPSPTSESSETTSLNDTTTEQMTNTTAAPTTTEATTAAGPTTEVLKTFNGSDYFLRIFDVPQTYEASKEFCHNWGGDLVSIHSQTENDFVQNLFNATEYNETAWIGLVQANRKYRCFTVCLRPINWGKYCKTWWSVNGDQVFIHLHGTHCGVCLVFVGELSLYQFPNKQKQPRKRCQLLSVDQACNLAFPLFSGTKIWDDSSEVEFDNWSKDAEDTSNSTSCTVIQSLDGMWSSVNCTLPISALVCKKPSGTVCFPPHVLFICTVLQNTTCGVKFRS